MKAAILDAHAEPPRSRELAAHIVDGSVTIDLERLRLTDVATAWERQREGAGAELVMTP